MIICKKKKKSLKKTFSETIRKRGFLSYDQVMLSAGLHFVKIKQNKTKKLPETSFGYQIIYPGFSFFHYNEIYYLEFVLVIILEWIKGK